MVLMEPDLRDIIAQGGLVDEGAPLLSSAVDLEEDVSKVIMYDDMNNAINVIDVGDMEIPRRRRNTGDQVNDSNPFQPTSDNEFQDPDIEDLEKMVKMQAPDEKDQKNSTLVSLGQQWERQQRDLTQV
tara:strand:- start:836 stop:1219 length:384 start_codon:yes stop_codon:yes gene_type:complete